MPLIINSKRAIYTENVDFQYLEIFPHFPLYRFSKKWYLTSASASFSF